MREERWKGKRKTITRVTGIFTGVESDLPISRYFWCTGSYWSHVKVRKRLFSRLAGRSVSFRPWWSITFGFLQGKRKSLFRYVRMHVGTCSRRVDLAVPSDCSIQLNRISLCPLFLFEKMFHQLFEQVETHFDIGRHRWFIYANNTRANYLTSVRVLARISNIIPTSEIFIIWESVFRTCTFIRREQVPASSK